MSWTNNIEQQPVYGREDHNLSDVVWALEGIDCNYEIYLNKKGNEKGATQVKIEVNFKKQVVLLLQNFCFLLQ